MCRGTGKPWKFLSGSPMRLRFRHGASSDRRWHYQEDDEKNRCDELSNGRG